MLPLVLLAALGVSAIPGAAQDPSPGPPDDYLRFDTVRVRTVVQTDGRQDVTVDVGVLLRTTQAVTEFGQVAIPYVDGLAEVAFEDVAITKPGGQTVELNDLVPEAINPFGASGLPVPADIRISRVTIPGLEPGDRLAYRAVVRQRPLAPGRIFGEAQFTPMASDPMQVYELDLPRDLPIRVKLREGLGAQWEDVPAPPDRLVRRLTLRVPRPNPGSDGPGEDEVETWSSPDVIFTNFRSWEEVGAWWSALSKGRLTPDPSITAEAAAITAGRETPREKIEAIHAFVASRIRYLSVGFGIGRMQPRPAPEVLASRYGDCKDKHALIQALAAAAGLDVRPVLVNSVRKALSDDVPSPQQFDHMISVARLGPEPALWLWLDSTNPLGPAGYLTPNLRDKRALLIDDGGRTDLVRTPADPPFTQRTEAETVGSLEASGVLRAHVRWTFRSDDEPSLRAIFAAAPKDRHAEGAKRALARSWKDAEVSNVTFSDPSDVSGPFRIEFDVEQKAAGRRSDKEWPLWIPLPDFELPDARKEVGPEEKAARFDVREFVVRATIALPEGTSARAPLSVSLERPFGQFRSSYSAEGRALRVERTIKLARGHVTGAEVGSYESFRNAVTTDRKQDFMVGALSAGAGTAEMLHAEGTAALKEKDHARAAELLRKAAQADPKLKDVWNDLGQALREKGDHGGAIEAFGRQIEVDPFHEAAYAHRAWVLIGLGRWEDAEKDLLKQIEVAPFRAWSYARMGERRMAQRRLREAADYFARAATIEPRDIDHWISAGWAEARDGRKEEARSALVHAASLGPKDWHLVSLARAHAAIGDETAAGDIAATAVVSIRDRLARLSPGDVDEDSLYWVARLAEAWQVVGAAALAAGDREKAEKHLLASWRTSFLPEAAWSLGLLRAQQARLKEAAEWLSVAESLAGADWRLPAGYSAVAAAARKKADPGSRPAALVMRDRQIKLSDAAVEDLDEEVLLLVGADGTVESLKSVSAKRPAAFARQVKTFGPLRLAIPRPDERPVKLVLRGLLSCNKLSACALALDIPGAGSTAAER